jgi:sugar lactone lactonase YvrE
LDTDSQLIVADSGNHCIRRVTTDEGRVTTVAGRAEHPGSADGEAADALFNHPCGIAVDGNNNVLVADTKNNAIRFGVCLRERKREEREKSRR